MGGHETVEPRPSVSSYRQKFMHLGLDPSRHGQIVARGKGSRGRTARGQTESTKPHGPAKFGGRPVSARTLRYKSIPRVAVRVVPLYVAEIVAEVEMRTKDVLIVKVALVAPAGTVTLDGTLAAPLLLERKT